MYRCAKEIATLLFFKNIFRNLTGQAWGKVIEYWSLAIIPKAAVEIVMHFIL